MYLERGVEKEKRFQIYISDKYNYFIYFGLVYLAFTVAHPDRLSRGSLDDGLRILVLYRAEKGTSHSNHTNFQSVLSNRRFAAGFLRVSLLWRSENELRKIFRLFLPKNRTSIEYQTFGKFNFYRNSSEQSFDMKTVWKILTFKLRT